MKTPTRTIISIIAIATLASCGSRTTDSVAMIASETVDQPAGNLEDQTLSAVNRYRASKGLPQLQSHPGLEKLARQHSLAMQKRDEMGHFAFAKRAKTAQARFQMGAMSENLHRSWGIVPSGQSITNQWKNSPKHRDNMEGRYNYAGMAIVRDNDRIFTTLLLGQGVGANAPTGNPEPFLHF